MHQKCIIWGAGNYGRRLAAMLEREGYTIVAFCDTNADLAGKKVEGHETITVETAKEMCHEDQALAVVIGIFDLDVVEEVESIIQDTFAKDTEVKIGRDIQDAFENRMIKEYHQNMTFKWKVDLEKCFLTWLDNVMSEVEYWVKDVADYRGKRHEYNVKCRKNNIFTHRDICQQVKDGEIVMDIGCGLVSKFGNQFNDGGTVQLIPVDALAHFYNIINDRIQDGFKRDYVCHFGLFEFLGNIFGGNYADYIIVDNALDHCIDPWKSLVECLYVLKPGGHMYLNHRRAEAVYEGWSGLHKWNIDCDAGNLLIWNKENAVNVTEDLKDFAEIHVKYDDSVSSREHQNVGVEIVKKRDFELGSFWDEYKENVVLVKFIDKLMERMASDSRAFFRVLEQMESVC